MMPTTTEHHQSAGEVRVGIASWYQTDRHRVCASNFIPIGSRVLVRFGEFSTVVRVVGTGPREDLGRIIDLSPDAFHALAPLSRGIITVEVTILKD